MKSDKLNDFYQLSDTNQPVKLTVDICYGHNAVSKLLLNQHMVQGQERDGSFGRSFEKVLGTNAELKNKRLQLTTLVLHTLKSDDRTCIILSLTGGTEQYSRKLESVAPEIGGVVKYTVSIQFCG